MNAPARGGISDNIERPGQTGIRIRWIAAAVAPKRSRVHDGLLGLSFDPHRVVTPQSRSLSSVGNGGDRRDEEELPGLFRLVDSDDNVNSVRLVGHSTSRSRVKGRRCSPPPAARLSSTINQR